MLGSKGRVIVCFMLMQFFIIAAMAQQPRIIPPYDMSRYDHVIQTIYKSVLNNPNDDFDKRIIKVNNYFLGKPYVLGALGEGQNGEFDQQPLYRTDEFDCTTYVETLLALAEAKNFSEFQTTIEKIRYHNKQISFLDRNHFTSVDWNSGNQKNGYIKDITGQFQLPYKITDTLIDKPNWYRTLPVSNMQLLSSLNPQQMQALLKKFRANAEKVKAERSHTRFIPLTELFSNANGAIVTDKGFFDSMPTVSIIEIVRDNYDLTAKIGTHLDITHLGFAIRTRQGLMFYEASELNDRTLALPLDKYLLSYYKFAANRDSIGINIEKII